MKLPTTVAELVIDHAYYCSDSNYTCHEPSPSYESVSDFLSEYGNADLDYNMVFRWDVKSINDDNAPPYAAHVYMMQQRRGHFVPISIDLIEDADVPAFVEYLQKRHEYLKQLWLPFE